MKIVSVPMGNVSLPTSEDGKARTAIQVYCYLNSLSLINISCHHTYIDPGSKCSTMSVLHGPVRVDSENLSET